MKVLIVDDNGDNLYYLSSLLEGEGHEVVSAENGIKALEKLKKRACDLIISDVLMPGMDGFQLCRECKKDSDLSGIPFIFYTATYTGESDRKFGLDIGADEYIVKPVEPDEFLDAIDRIIRSERNRGPSTAGDISGDDTAYFSEYNRRLIEKLERKMMQLEENKRELEKQIMERQQAEELIKESEERFRTIFDTVNDAIFLVDTDKGTILDMNRVTCDMFGYEYSEMSGFSLEELCAGDLPGHAVEDMRRLVSEVVEGEPRFFEWKIKDRAGRVFWVEMLMKLVRIGAKDSMLVVIRDIQTRKEAEEALNDERLKLQTLSENAPFGMVLIDNEGRFTYMNASFREMFGYGLVDVPDSRTWFRKACPDDRARRQAVSVWKEGVLSARPGEKKMKVLTVTCKDGSRKTVNFIPLKLASGHHLVTCEDITEFKKLESQLRQSHKMEAIGQLAGGIAHDFNNILTTMMGYAGLLQMEMDEHNPLGLYVDQIIAASQKAANLTGGLLAFSRQQPVVLNPTNINESIRSAEKLLKRLLTEDVEFKVSLAPHDMIIIADATQIDQILFNLVANARDAMSKGGVLVIETSMIDIDDEFVGVHGQGEPGRYVRITVSDTGVGMDEMTREKIFEPFFSTKEVGKGTGLGLSTVYGIVKQHNGFINVYSEPGNGTTFRIYFPLVRLEAPQEREPEPVVRRGREAILVAEDNTDLRRLVKEVLEKHGYRIVEAVDGEDAVEKFKDHREIDLMIVDSIMPKKNGREVYEDVKKLDPAIKVLFTSGHAKDTVLSKGIADSEFDFLPKPISPTRLLHKVREVLDKEPGA